MIEQSIKMNNGDVVYISIHDRLTIDDVFQYSVKKGIYDIITGVSIDTSIDKDVRDDFMYELRG